MFAEESKSILLPYLINILNGIENTIPLASTTHSFISDKGLAIGTNENLSPKNKSVAVLNIHHPIFKYDQVCGPSGTQTMMAMLEQWKAEENIIGVVFDYNSGGGQGSGTPEIADYIFNYPKPTVSYTNDICGSAAYYMFAASKYTFINKYADFIGCIGSMFLKVNTDGILEQQGASIIEVYSDLSPEKNKQSRALKEGDTKPLIDKILNPSASVFHADLKRFRPTISENALKGDLFSPEDSIQEGLVDKIGTLQDAINKVIELASSSQQNNSKSNTNKNMSAKTLLVLQAVLGLDAPLASTEENGSYLNAEQLDTLENRLVELDASNTDLQTKLDAALANTEVNDQLTASQGTVTALEASINEMLTSAGLDVTGTLTEKTAALSTKVAEMGGQDGAKPTNVKVDVNNSGTTSNVVDGIDISAAMNN